MKRVITQNIFLTIFGKSLAFILSMSLAKHLAVKDYSDYLKLGLLISFAPYFQFGTMNGFPYFASKFIKENGSSIFENTFQHYNYVTIILLIPYLLFIFIYDSSLKLDTVGLIFTIALFQKIIENYVLYLNSLMKFESVNFIRLLAEVLTPAFQIWIFFSLRNYMSVYFANALMLILIFIIFKYYFFKNNRVIYFKIFEIKEMFKLGIPIYLVWLLDFGLRNLDKIFISKQYNSEDFALYGFVSSLSLIQWMLALNFISPYVPSFLNIINEKKWDRVEIFLKEKNKMLIKISILLTIISILGYPILTIFIVKKYFAGYTLFLILLINSVLIIINNFNIYFLTAIGKSNELLKILIKISLLNLTIDYIIVFYHLKIIFFAISSMFNFLIYYVFLRKEVSIHLIKLKEKNFFTRTSFLG